MKNDEWGGSLTGIESWFNENVVVVVVVLIVVMVIIVVVVVFVGSIVPTALIIHLCHPLTQQ